MAVETRPATETTELTLPVTGMTCASCVRHVEKALGRVEGVQEAAVNLATEKATVRFDPSRAGIEDLRAAVERAGYKLGAPPNGAVPALQNAVPAEETASKPLDRDALEQQRETDELRRKWQVALAVGLVMMALTYLPLRIPQDILAPLLLIAATVVQFWAGRVFYESAWSAARHGSTNMNTLVAGGGGAACRVEAVDSAGRRASTLLAWRGTVVCERRRGVAQ